MFPSPRMAAGVLLLAGLATFADGTQARSAPARAITRVALLKQVELTSRELPRGYVHRSFALYPHFASDLTVQPTVFGTHCAPNPAAQNFWRGGLFGVVWKDSKHLITQCAFLLTSPRYSGAISTFMARSFTYAPQYRQLSAPSIGTRSWLFRYTAFKGWTVYDLLWQRSNMVWQLGYLGKPGDMAPSEVVAIGRTIDRNLVRLGG